jgi:hypothetical protein
MNNPESAEAELRSAMFASLVLQQTNMATIFLGLAPNPQTGKTETNLDHAKYFIDLLEMLEAKTKGNLQKHEEGLLKQSLTSLRLAFVEAAGKPPGPATEAASAAPAGGETPSGPAPGQEMGGSRPEGPRLQAKPAAAESGPEAPGAVPPAAEDTRKKFTKKY